MQDPFNPITRPVTSRRKRSSISSETETNDRPDSDETQTSITNSSTINDHFEKYDVEAVEIDRGNDTTGEDDLEYDGGVSLDVDKVYTAADYRISKPNDLSTARWSLFKGIEMLAERFVVSEMHTSTPLFI